MNQKLYLGFNEWENIDDDDKTCNDLNSTSEDLEDKKAN